MYVKRFSVILLLSVLRVAVADIDSSADVAVTSEVKVSEDVFHLAKTCKSDVDCHHLGKCVAGTTGKFCKCKVGTSGDFCEKVDDCANNPVKCGTLDDVSCVFDIEKEVAVCKCDNVAKTYVEDEERCMSPCMDDSNCGKYGSCYPRIGNKKFCACQMGTSGDHCEIIDACHNKEVDCGVDDKATCTLDGQGKAYCKCDDATTGFDYDEKRCKDCSGCGGKDVLQGACSYRGGIRICSCTFSYFSNKLGKCEDCKCGKNSYGCQLENGTKICQCFSGTADNNGLCQQCVCVGGQGASGCEFKDGKKVCTCREGYALTGPNGPCKQCDCGFFSKSCTFTRGKKTCNCEDSYKDKQGKCTLCSCTGKSNENGCKFDDAGNMKCECLKGYAQFGSECNKCDCGDHGKCSLTTWRSKQCTCDEGYIDDNGMCKECNCGKNGQCTFLYGGTKMCKCFPGYKVYQGTCKGCFCQNNADCELDKFGNAKCTCASGYGLKDGVCTRCNCEPGTSCVFGETNRYSTRENKVCICPKGYADDYYGRCRSCDCEVEGSNCTYSVGFMHCKCPKGYTEENKGFSMFSKICKDIDECRNSISCPHSSTKCVNTPGSYECVCNDGYEKSHSSDDIERDGCADINECVRDYRPCNDAAAECVNTPGSYRCVCKSGYWLKATEEKRNMCGAARPWRTATIVVGIASTVIIVGLLIGVCKKCSSS